MTVKLQDVDPPDQVSDAFKDVISAQQDRERLINEARGYANDVVPKARGQAAQLLNEAEGYRLAKIQEAQGAAQRFVALYDEYAKAKDVTRQRLYLETMEEILPRRRQDRHRRGGGRADRALPAARPDAAPAQRASRARAGAGTVRTTMDKRWLAVVAVVGLLLAVWNLAFFTVPVVDAGRRPAARRAGAHRAASPACT